MSKKEQFIILLMFCFQSVTNIKKNLLSHIGPTKQTSALIKSLKTVLNKGKKDRLFLVWKNKYFLVPEMVETNIHGC